MRGIELMALIGLAACAGAPTEPVVGDLVVVTSTSGSAADADGYRLEVDGRTAATLDPDGSSRIADLAPGAHQVRLADVAANCRVAGANPRRIVLPESQSVEVTFTVTCGVDVTLQVIARTGGRSVDPDGFLLGVDGAEPLTLPANGSLELEAPAPGDHELVLGGIADNCEVDGDNPRRLTLPASGAVTTLFEVTCRAVPATLVVKVATEGAAPDPNGYTVSVDGGSARALATADSVEVPSEIGARHRLVLGDVAPLCYSDDANPFVLEITTPVVTAAWRVHCPGLPSTGRILYAGEARSATHLFAMRPDGTGSTDLTPDLSAFVGRWSPDGERIAFEHGGEDGSEIWVMSSTGRDAARLAPGQQPTWSPDGSRIAFVRGGTLHVMDADGSNVRAVPLARRARDPEWFPDGRTLVYSGEDLTHCTLLPTFDVACAWELHAIGLDGSNPRVLTHAPSALSAARSPVFSPGGTRIAFWISSLADAVLDGALYLVAPDGTALTRLDVAPGAVAAFPVWSPDGEMLAFGLRGFEDAAFDIALAPRRGGEPVRILTEPGEQLPTSWR
jgi:TolB protein